MTNKIEVYQKNNKTITCTVTGLDITGYAAYLSVKSKTTDPSTTIFNSGTVTDSSTAVFYLTSTDTSVNPANYIYDITVEADSSIYTIVKDSFDILDSARY